MMQIPLKPLSLLFRATPNFLNTEILVRLFNHLLKGQSLDQQLGELNGKQVVIDITDTDSRLGFMIRGGRLYRCDALPSDADVCIRGQLLHFWQLASRAEDPDTLFFRRQLAIEGDTATGLYIKNLLDGLDYDWDAHFHALLGRRLAAVLWKGRGTSNEGRGKTI